MLHLVRRSLLMQLLSVYLLFVCVVLVGGVAVNNVVEQQLRNDVQASDQALAQEIALETNLQIRDAESSLVALGKQVAQVQSEQQIADTFQTYKLSRPDVDHVYWLDPVGVLRVTWPLNSAALDTEFSPPDVVQRARMSTSPVFEVGIAVETTFNAGVIIAQPMRTSDGRLLGIVAASISLVELSEPLVSVVNAQQQQGRHLMISVIDGHGVLVATPQRARILQTVLDELPGANQALHNQVASRLGRGQDGQDWLFSAVPISDAGWAVVVQRPSQEALAVVAQFHLWLLAVILLFAMGGLLFWLILLGRVIRPLHMLAHQHQALPSSKLTIPVDTTILATRGDEVGALARSLIRLELDGLDKLGELRTLLETSNAVVGSLEPHAVVRKIIREARRLVDVQAAAVLLPDEAGVLRVLVSDGHSEHYDQELALTPEHSGSAPVIALRDGAPVQKLLSSGTASFSYEDGFRSVLAIPIISRHAGGVVLLVHRTEPHLFNQNEIDLLLTFANYATLAWEHAVLYERSDERLHEVARENERLYQHAAEEKHKLAAIMESMHDGLVLTGVDGVILYANQSASTLVGLSSAALEHRPISTLYAAMGNIAVDFQQTTAVLAQIEIAAIHEAIVTILSYDQHSAIHLRLFDVNDELGESLGRGLLLRDVTREHEMNEFKTTLLAAVGHEVRTPLAAIKGYASTLLQEDVSWSMLDQRHFLQMISSEADRLTQLVKNLLDLSRQEAGLLQLSQAPTRIQELIVTVLEQQRIQHPTVSMQMQFSSSLPAVNIDSSRIEVVLHNLVANAAVYGEGTMTIQAECQGDYVVVSVSNSGQGIAPDELPHVFERFYRARYGRQQRLGGTGLGLAICKAFVEAHGCKIWAESSERITTIAFSLPIAVTVNPTAETLVVDISPEEWRRV
ncbi:ATP-binding protein [Dictyobacter kobayashii]|uniref:histidine kinase n=1 Tax=Dictyobacter kobayashii TaxID=2014872 RepID=A0A402ATL4_9CHLR|nr:ATP-binding protein [Dictyobacter kobayashii]GCE22450.1 hypothetical protein KDK_62500 [Dictyobacter kobayashii]